MTPLLDLENCTPASKRTCLSALWMADRVHVMHLTTGRVFLASKTNFPYP